MNTQHLTGVLVTLVILFFVGACWPVAAQDKSPKHTPSAPVAATPQVTTPPAAPAQSAPHEMEPTQLERLQLDLVQKDAVIAQQQSQMLRVQFQAIQVQMQQSDSAVGAAMKALSDKADAIKKAHGWGDDVNFNQNFGPNAPPFTRTDKPAPAPPAADANKTSTPKQ